VAVVLGAAVSLTVALGMGGLVFGGELRRESSSLGRAREVMGQVGELRGTSDATAEAVARVVYSYQGREYSASDVSVRADAAERLARGSPIRLLIDPENPSSVLAADEASSRRGVLGLGWVLLGLGAVSTFALAAFEIRRAIKLEVDPIRLGAIVWVTPDAPKGIDEQETRFPAHYFENDVRREVLVRGRRGRAPVRRGVKLLAAVVPTRPRFARLIDEDLARSLGWSR
jgi:hypothetical protein